MYPRINNRGRLGVQIQPSPDIEPGNQIDIVGAPATVFHQYLTGKFPMAVGLGSQGGLVILHDLTRHHPTYSAAERHQEISAFMSSHLEVGVVLDDGRQPFRTS